MTAYVTASGGTVKTTGQDGKAGGKFYGACLANPLYNVGFGTGGTIGGANSGIILRLDYFNISNPNAMGGDIGFVRSCFDDGSGSTLINDTCTSSGCVSSYTTGTANWQGNQFIKYTPRGTPNASFKARITVRVEDNLGE